MTIKIHQYCVQCAHQSNRIEHIHFFYLQKKIGFVGSKSFCLQFTIGVFRGNAHSSSCGSNKIVGFKTVFFFKFSGIFFPLLLLNILNVYTSSCKRKLFVETLNVFNRLIYGSLFSQLDESCLFIALKQPFVVARFLS